MRKITLTSQHASLLRKVPEEHLGDILLAITQFLEGQQDITFSDPLSDIVFTALTMDAKTEDRRKYTSAENGRKHTKNLISKIGSEKPNSENRFKEKESHNNDNIFIKDVNIDNGNYTIQDDNNNIQDNIQDLSVDNIIQEKTNINVGKKEVLFSEENEKKPSKEDIDFDMLRLYFNSKMKGQAIRPVKTMTDVRKRAVSARARMHGKQSIQTVIDKAAASDFLNGHNNRNWVADFNWIFQENRFVDILEGKYDNNKKQSYATGQNNGYACRDEQREAERQRRLEGYAEIIREGLEDAASDPRALANRLGTAGDFPRDTPVTDSIEPF